MIATSVFSGPRRSGRRASAEGRRSEGERIERANEHDRRAFSLLGPAGRAAAGKPRRGKGLSIRPALVSGIEAGVAAGEDVSEIRAELLEADRLRWSIVHENAHFIRSIVRKMVRKIRTGTANEDDLFQAMSIGAFEAAARFDPSLGISFRTYAGWWMRAQATRLVDYHLSSSAGAQEKLAVVLRASAEISSVEGRDATLAEISRATGYEESTLADLRILDVRPHSMSFPLRSDSGDDGGLLEDLVADPEAETEESLCDRATAIQALGILADLSEIEREVVLRIFGGGGTLSSVAEETGRSREGIRSIRDGAIEKIQFVLGLRSRIPRRRNQGLSSLRAGEPIEPAARADSR